MRKRVISIAAATTAAAVLLTGSVFVQAAEEAAEPAETQSTEYDYGTHTEYPLREVWDSEAFPGATIASLLAGSEDFDREGFLNSTMGEITIQRQVDSFISHAEDDDPELIAYWAEQGVVKELHDKDDPYYKWATYTPAYMLEEENADEVYPVLFVLHGDGNTIMMAEAWGFAQICAEKGFIAVMPEMHNMDDWESEIPRIYKEVVENYPVDVTRVYIAGFSKGGRTTFMTALAYPELFAACAPGGSTLNCVEPEKIDNITEGMPMCLIGGTVDMIPIFPVLDQSMSSVFVEGELPPSSEYIEKWLAVNGLDREVAAPAEDATEAEQVIGLDMDVSEKIALDGSYYDEGYYVDENGTKVIGFVAAEGMPHWPSPSHAVFAWEFVSQFTRENAGLPDDFVMPERPVHDDDSSGESAGEEAQN